MERYNNNPLYLCEENCDYHFFSVAWGTSKPREMVVRWLFRDSESKKNYLVFTPVDDITEKYLREYHGDYREERYIRIADRQIVYAIKRLLTEVNVRKSEIG